MKNGWRYQSPRVARKTVDEYLAMVEAEAELREYIAQGEKRLKKSRTIAADFCAARISEMVEVAQ